LEEHPVTIAKLIITAGLAVSALTGLGLSVAPANAQTTIIQREDEGDASVTIRRHANRWDNDWDRPRGVTIYGEPRCRTVTIRREMDNGDTVVRRIRKCR
jgi:hypothetical protein